MTEKKKLRVEVPNYENYLIDEYWSIERNWRTLKQQINRYWYTYIWLYKNWKRKKFTVHRLVMLVFIWESNLQVNHIDWDKSNNHLSNLEYCTAKENTNHADINWFRNIKWEDNYKARKVNQYTLDWIFIKTFNYIHQAYEELWIFQSNNCLMI